MAPVLPFHSSLFQPAVDLQAPVSAAHIAYTIPDGIAGTEACYLAPCSLFPHLINLLGKHSVTATVGFSQNIFRFTDRKQAARQMHQEVERLRNATVGGDAMSAFREFDDPSAEPAVRGFLHEPAQPNGDGLSLPTAREQIARANC